VRGGLTVKGITSPTSESGGEVGQRTRGAKMSIEGAGYERALTGRFSLVYDGSPEWRESEAASGRNWGGHR